MSAMPLSFTGAFLGLYFADMNMSLFSMWNDPENIDIN
jgi:HAE1 family hydrophobic/amphiphilic exporter-1